MRRWPRCAPNSAWRMCPRPPPPPLDLEPGRRGMTHFFDLTPYQPTGRSQEGSTMKAVIAAYARSPFHSATKGALAQTRPDTLAAQTVKGLLNRVDLDPALLEDLI